MGCFHPLSFFCRKREREKETTTNNPHHHPQTTSPFESAGNSGRSLFFERERERERSLLCFSLFLSHVRKHHKCHHTTNNSSAFFVFFCCSWMFTKKQKHVRKGIFLSFVFFLVPLAEKGVKNFSHRKPFVLFFPFLSPRKEGRTLFGTTQTQKKRNHNTTPTYGMNVVCCFLFFVLVFRFVFRIEITQKLHRGFCFGLEMQSAGIHRETEIKSMIEEQKERVVCG